MMEDDRDKDAETQRMPLKFREVDRMIHSRNENLMKTFGTCHFYPSASRPPVSIYLPYQLYSAYMRKCQKRSAHFNYSQTQCKKEVSGTTEHK